jgi:hypothetical protein
MKKLGVFTLCGLGIFFWVMIQSCTKKIDVLSFPVPLPTSTPTATCSNWDNPYNQPASLITTQALQTGEFVLWQDALVANCFPVNGVVTDFHVFVLNNSASLPATLQLGVYNTNSSGTALMADTNLTVPPGGSGWYSESMAATIMNIGTLDAVVQALTSNISIGVGPANPSSEVDDWLYSPLPFPSPFPSLTTLLNWPGPLSPPGIQSGGPCYQMNIDVCYLNLPCAGAN